MKKNKIMLAAGTEVSNYNGQCMTVFKTQEDGKVDAIFRDGTPVWGIDPITFLNGNVKKPDVPESGRLHKRVGTVGYTRSNHERMVVIQYRNSTDLDVRFDDGAVVCHVTWSNFKTGLVGKKRARYYDVVVPFETAAAPATKSRKRRA